MSNFDIFARLVAISIVGGVAKALFTSPRPVHIPSVGDSLRSVATEAVSSATKRATS